MKASLIGDPRGDRRYLIHLNGVFTDRARQERYISDGIERMQVVLELLNDLQGSGMRRVLELGANPYVMTLLMKRRFTFELSLANYFGEPASDAPSVHTVTLDGAPIDLPFKAFNIERDRFPYEDASFDCVLFCEILEHLLVDPGHAVGEISRVLRPGGSAIVSTPNATRLPNLFFLAQGLSIWDGYSDNGPYGRHNREFSLSEVHDLLQSHGLLVVRSAVRNIQHLARRYTWLQWLRPTVWNEHLFVVAQKPGGPTT